MRRCPHILSMREQGVWIKPRDELLRLDPTQERHPTRKRPLRPNERCGLSGPPTSRPAHVSIPGRPGANIESGEVGPCLTDAAHEAALDEPFVACRYAVIRTGIPAMIAALNPGGVM